MDEEAVEIGQELIPRKPDKPALVAGEDGYIIPTNVEEAYRFAEAICAAGLAPNSYNNDPKKVMLGVMAALEAGLPPLYGLRQIAIINGRPSLWGDGAQALIQKSGQLADYHVEWLDVEGFDYSSTPIVQWPDAYGIKVSMWRKGQDHPYVGTFTVGDAKRAHLWIGTQTGSKPKVPWIDHPRRMLLARARAFAQRDGFADALAGLSIREEMEDTFNEEDHRPEIDLKAVPIEDVPPMPEDQNGVQL